MAIWMVHSHRRMEKPLTPPHRNDMLYLNKTSYSKCFILSIVVCFTVDTVGEFPHRTCSLLVLKNLVGKNKLVACGTRFPLRL